MLKITYKPGFRLGFQYIVHTGLVLDERGYVNIVGVFPTVEAAQEYVVFKGAKLPSPVDPDHDYPSCGKHGTRDPYRTFEGKVRTPRFCGGCGVEFSHFRPRRAGG